MTHQSDLPRSSSPPADTPPAADKGDFEAALAKLKRVSKRAPAGDARTRAADESDQRLRRIEERLHAVEEALHALQARSPA